MKIKFNIKKKTMQRKLKCRKTYCTCIIMTRTRQILNMCKLYTYLHMLVNICRILFNVL